MKHIFIINPNAGNGKYQQELINNIKYELNNEDIDYEIYISKSREDIKKYIINKSEEKLPMIFYSCGGDGTLHNVINAACNYVHVFVGVVPCGSGNDFVKNFDKGEFLNIKNQIAGKSVKIDLIKVNDKYSVSVSNMGLDADVAFNMDKFRWIPFITGTGRYFLSILYCLFNKLGKTYEVTIDNSIVLKDNYLIGVLANGHTYGGGYKCAPKAKINDGIIDLCFIKNLSRFKILSLLSSYKAGTHLENQKLKKYITYEKCENVRITGDEPINICIDGENYTYDNLDIKIVRDALKFWVPKDTLII